jgi:hypothetical protein
MSSVSSVTTTSSARRSFWTICKACRTSIRSDATDCKTCKGIASKELFLCPVGTDDLRRYHKKGIFGKNCINCIFAGLYEARTAAQESAIAQRSLCSGVCGLDQKIGQDFCRDCQAVANTNPVAAKRLATIRREAEVALHEEKWQTAIWSGAFKAAKTSTAKEVVAKATSKAKPVTSLDLDEEEGKAGLKTWKQYKAEKALL